MEKLRYITLGSKPLTRMGFVQTIDDTTVCFIPDRTASLVHVGTCGANKDFIGITTEPWAKGETWENASTRAWGKIYKLGGARFINEFCYEVLSSTPVKEQKTLLGKDYLKALKESCEAFKHDKYMG